MNDVTGTSIPHSGTWQKKEDGGFTVPQYLTIDVANNEERNIFVSLILAS